MVTGAAGELNSMAGYGPAAIDSASRLAQQASLVHIHDCVSDLGPAPSGLPGGILHRVEARVIQLFQSAIASDRSRTSTLVRALWRR